MKNKRNPTSDNLIQPNAPVRQIKTEKEKGLIERVDKKIVTSDGKELLKEDGSNIL